MRILNMVLCALMVLFAAAQYNDPDGPLWMALYAVPAALAGLAGFRPTLLRPTAARAGLAICLVLYLGATLYYWPTEASWWRIDVWWDSEESREGMGMMISTAVIAVAGIAGLLIGRSQAAVASRQP